MPKSMKAVELGGARLQSPILLAQLRLQHCYTPTFHDCNLWASSIALRRLGDSSRIADDAASTHTPTMTLKNAALLALIGTILATVLLVWTFVSTALQRPAGIGSSGNAVP